MIKVFLFERGEEPMIGGTFQSAYIGNNDDLIATVLQFYLPKDGVVADITFGKGVFWRKVDTTRFTLLTSDIFVRKRKYDLQLPMELELRCMDFRKLDYSDGSIDVVVFDPPYTHNPGNHVTEKNYRLAATTRGMYHRDIIELYRQGMQEATRVIKPEGGQVWVKCKDEIESGIQRWSHVEIYEIARELGMFARDLFVLVPTSRVGPSRWKRQLHARKTHSYLWIFERPRKRDRAALAGR
jgi:hypothetical protein